MGLLRGRSQVPGDRQLPRSSGWCRSAPSPSHARLPGVLPAPRLHLRPRAGAPSPGQAARGVPYVRERFFKGGEFTGLSDMRSAARRWCLAVAGQRVHGTTRRQPLVVFRDEERHALGEWDAEPYEMTDWRTAKVQPPHSLPVRPLLSALRDVPARAESGGSARQQTGAHLPLGKADQGPPSPGPRRQIHRPRRLPAELSLHPQIAGASQAQRGVTGTGRGRPMPSVSSPARCHGPSSGRDTSSCAWENTTPRSVSMPHAGGLSP